MLFSRSNYPHPLPYLLAWSRERVELFGRNLNGTLFFFFLHSTAKKMMEKKKKDTEPRCCKDAGNNAAIIVEFIHLWCMNCGQRVDWKSAKNVIRIDIEIYPKKVLRIRLNKRKKKYIYIYICIKRAHWWIAKERKKRGVSFSNEPLIFAIFISVLSKDKSKCWGNFYMYGCKVNKRKGRV